MRRAIWSPFVWIDPFAVAVGLEDTLLECRIDCACHCTSNGSPQAFRRFTICSAGPLGQPSLSQGILGPDSSSIFAEAIAAKLILDEDIAATDPEREGRCSFPRPRISHPSPWRPRSTPTARGSTEAWRRARGALPDWSLSDAFGERVFHGIPFDLGAPDRPNVVLCGGGAQANDVRIDLEPIRASFLVFLHAVEDQRGA